MKRIRQLDSVRGLAVLLVLVHNTDIYPSLHLGLITNAGWSGVDLFFVLSGFLITGILIDTKEAQNYFSSFYARRMLRIFPLYYAVLTLLVIVALHPTQIYYYLYLSNWLILLKDGWQPNVAGHFWSLAVEEQFYLIWPLCVWLLPKRYRLRFTLAGCVFALMLRLGLVATYGPSRAIARN